MQEFYNTTMGATLSLVPATEGLLAISANFGYTTESCDFGAILAIITLQRPIDWRRAPCFLTTDIAFLTPLVFLTPHLVKKTRVPLTAYVDIDIFSV